MTAADPTCSLVAGGQQQQQQQRCAQERTCGWGHGAELECGWSLEHRRWLEALKRDLELWGSASPFYAWWMEKPEPQSCGNSQSSGSPHQEEGERPAPELSGLETRASACYLPHPTALPFHCGTLDAFPKSSRGRK